MNMENKRMLLAKIYIIPSLIKSLMISIFLSSGLLCILLMIQRFIFNDIDINYYGLLIYALIVIACLILTMMMYAYLQTLSKEEEWYHLINEGIAVIKDGEYSQSAIYDHGPLIVGKYVALRDKGHFEAKKGFFHIISDRKAEAALLALLLGDEIPKVQKYKLLFMVAPLCLLLISFIPTYIQSYAKLQDQKEILSSSLDKISSVFETECDYVYSDDPNDAYYSYYVSGYLEDDDHHDYAYVNVSLNKEGVIDGVSYSIDIDVNKSKEENLQLAENTLDLFNSLLQRIDVKAVNEEMLKEHELSDSFVEWFLSASYYESEDFMINDQMMISYYSTSLEEYDDYGISYIYITIYEPY